LLTKFLIPGGVPTKMVRPQWRPCIKLTWLSFFQETMIDMYRSRPNSSQAAIWGEQSWHWKPMVAWGEPSFRIKLVIGGFFFHRRRWWIVLQERGDQWQVTYHMGVTFRVAFLILEQYSAFWIFNSFNIHYLWVPMFYPLFSVCIEKLIIFTHPPMTSTVDTVPWERHAWARYGPSPWLVPLFFALLITTTIS
jgi:hypothetical protein